MDLATLHASPTPGAGPSNRRSLAAWLLQVADSDGVTLDADRILLPLTVTALNTRLGRSPRCGTLYRRIRDLHPAVSRSAGGLILDRAALTREAAGARTRPTVAPTPPLPLQPPPPPVAAHGDALELARAACRLLDQALALLTIQTTASTPDAPPAIALRSRAGRTRDPSDFAAFSGQGGREVAVSLEETTPSLTVVPRTANAATAPVSREDLTQLLAPLVEVCRRTGLVGVTDTSGLHRALAPYQAWQIRNAVALICRLTKAGSIKSSPIGWLVAKARDGDLDYFPDAAAATAPPPPAATRVEYDPVLEAAERGVAAAGVDELAALDEWIRTAPHHARIRHLIFDRAEMLQTARLEAWRALQEVAS